MGVADHDYRVADPHFGMADAPPGCRQPLGLLGAERLFEKSSNRAAPSTTR